MDSSCQKIEGQLADYILGILNTEEINFIDKHTSRCPECRQYMQALENENHILMQFGKDLEATMTARQDRAIEALSGSAPTSHREGISIWRIIMKSRITRLASAAVIIIAVVLSVTIFNNSTSTVWAIEQSIEALSKYKAVLFEGSESFLDEDGNLQIRGMKSWAVANADQTRVEKERHDVDGVPTLITNGKETWRYDPQTNTVIKNLPYGTPEGWIGSRFFEQLNAFIESGVINDWEVTYGKEPVTDKQRAFLTVAWLDKRYNGPRSMWFEFDVESKLVVRMKQWENAKWEGPPRIVSEKITYYESLPDQLFEFEIPEGATVIEK